MKKFFGFAIVLQLILLSNLVHSGPYWHRNESINEKIDVYSSYILKGKDVSDLVTFLNANLDRKYDLLLTKEITLTADAEIPTNAIRLKFEREGLLTGNYTVTLNSQQIDADFDSQCFGSDVTLKGTAFNRFVTPENWGAKGDGTTDDSSAIQAAYDFSSHLYIGQNTYLLNTPLTKLSDNVFNIQGVNSRSSILQQNGGKILDYTSKDYVAAKTFYGYIRDVAFIGDETTTEELVHFGTSDFNVFENVETRLGAANGWVFDGNFVGATRINDCFFNSNIGWSIKFDTIALNDVRLDGTRFDGAGENANSSGVYINAYNPSLNEPTNFIDGYITLENGKYERLDGYSIYVKKAQGVNIQKNVIAWASALLGHRSANNVVEGNVFRDVGATIIDSGYNNKVSDNFWSSGSGLPILTVNKGYNSLFERADNVKASGTDGWTFSDATDVNRVYNSPGAAPDVASIEITDNESANRDIAGIDGDSYYVFRGAFNFDQTVTTSAGGRVIISDTTGTTFDSGDLADTNNQRGGTEYQSYTFKTGSAVTTMNLQLISTDNETVYWHLNDLAKNIAQDNPGFDESWSGGLPGSDWSISGDLTVTQSSTSHSGGYSARVQLPATITGTSEFKIDNIGLTTGKMYEVSFWIKDQVTANGFTNLLTGVDSVASSEFGVGKQVMFSPGLEGWERITYQFRSHGNDSDGIVLVRHATGANNNAVDLLVDDLSIVEIDNGNLETNDILSDGKKRIKNTDFTTNDGVIERFIVPYDITAVKSATLNITLRNDGSGKTFSGKIKIYNSTSRRHTTEYMLNGSLDAPSAVKLSRISGLNTDYIVLGNVSIASNVLSIEVANIDSLDSSGILDCEISCYDGFNVESYTLGAEFNNTLTQPILETGQIYYGSGSPESVVTAPVGTLFLRSNGGASTTLYVKESGTGNTGWVGK